MEVSAIGIKYQLLAILLMVAVATVAFIFAIFSAYLGRRSSAVAALLSFTMALVVIIERVHDFSHELYDAISIHHTAPPKTTDKPGLL